MNKSIRSSLCVFFTLLCTSQILVSETVIFDMGGVLLGTSRFGVARSIGISKFIGYALLDRKNPAALQDILFETLKHFGIQNQTDETPCAYDGHRQLPAIMCNWLKGTSTGFDVIEKAYNHIDTLMQQNNSPLSSTREENLLKALIETIFNPEILAHNMYVIKKGKELVQLCKNRGHRVMILSNFDPFTFLYAQEKASIKELLDLFEPSDIVLSGAIHMIKPHHEIYEYLIEHYELDPAKCIFIDDQPENIQSAELFGITGILCNNHNDVYTKLTALLGI